VIKCSINGRSVSQIKYDEPYAGFKIHKSATVHQHHMLRKRLEGVLNDPPEFELVITIPSKVKIEQADPFNAAAQQALLSRSRQTPDVAATPGGPGTPGAPLTGRPDSMYTPYVPLNLRIEFTIEKIRDGFTFVGCEAGDMRYPHAYTTNTPLPGASCCLFPTLDGIHERWTWEFEITVPRTIGDIHKTEEGEAEKPSEAGEGLTNGINGATMDEGDDSSMDEDDDSDLEFVVVCSGDLIDEVRWLLYGTARC
jgi:transcription initiation factor TFIID subunit 2